MNKTPNDPPAQKEKREREQREIWKQQEREHDRVTPQDEPTEILPIPDIPKPGVDPRSWPEKDSKT